jgi:hypothetical protein
VYVSEHSLAASSVTIPSNLTFPNIFRPIIDSMLQRSPAFRRQCLRISQIPTLEVRVRTQQGNAPAGSRARTDIVTSKGGRIVATVTIKQLEHLAELIAHELEHVIERLDGVDFRARSSLSGTGVWHCDDGSYETTRAMRIGRTVALETDGDR